MAATFALFLAALLLGGLDNILAEEGSPYDTIGREFMFAIPNTYHDSLTTQLFATAQTQQVRTTVHVEVPSLGFSRHKEIGYREVALFDLPLEVTRTNEDNFRAGLVLNPYHHTMIVRASADISIKCILVTDNDFEQMDSFLAFPTDVLGLEYFITSSPGSYSRSQFTVSSTRNKTKVVITPRAPDSTSEALTEWSFIEVELNRAGSVAISSSDDLKGVRVKSNFPISVVVMSSRRFYEDVAAIEQLPPLSALGCSFVLADSGFLSVNIVYRVFVPFQNTTLTFSSNNIAISVQVDVDEKAWYDHRLLEDHVTILSSSKAVMVMKYIISEYVMSSVIISPTKQYASSDVIFRYSYVQPRSWFWRRRRPNVGVLNIAYLCRENYALNISNFGNISVTDVSDKSSTFCVKTFELREDLVTQIKSGGTAMFVWVEGSHSYPVQMQLKPQQCPSGENRCDGFTTNNCTGAEDVSGQPPWPSGPPGPSDVLVVVPLTVSVVVVSLVIAALCCFMKRNKLLPKCQLRIRKRHGHDVSRPSSAQKQRDEALPEAIPMHKRNSISVPDMRLAVPLVNSGAQPQFRHIRPSVERLVLVPENQPLPTGGDDARLNQHRTTFHRPIEHTYFTCTDQADGSAQEAHPSRPRRIPDPHIYHSVLRNEYDADTAADRESQDQQFASIDRRRYPLSRPTPAQLPEVSKKITSRRLPLWRAKNGACKTMERV